MVKQAKSGGRGEPPKTARGRATIAEPEKPLKPSQCRAFMRKHLAGSFPKIVQGFVRQAEAGSVAHVKLASELLESKRKAPGVSGRKNSARDVLRAWRERGTLVD